MKIKKVLKFYRVNKKTLSKELCAVYSYDADALIKKFEIPKDCSFFEVYCQIEHDVKKYHFESENLEFKTYDFSSAFKKKIPYEKYVEAALAKCKPPVIAGEIESPHLINTIGYGNEAHGDFTGEYSRVQHPEELDLQYVRVKEVDEKTGKPDNRIELFSQYVIDVPTQKGFVELTSPKLNCNVYCIGTVKEYKNGYAFGRTRDGQPFICESDKVISPHEIDECGRINLGNNKRL